MRPIDADELYKTVTEKYHDIRAGGYPYNIVAFHMAQLVKEAPTIEAEPLRHGAWHRTFVDGFNRWHFVYDCSECGIRTETTTKYCPHCGAKMDGGSR